MPEERSHGRFVIVGLTRLSVRVARMLAGADCRLALSEDDLVNIDAAVAGTIVAPDGDAAVSASAVAAGAFVGTATDERAFRRGQGQIHAPSELAEPLEPGDSAILTGPAEAIHCLVLVA